MQALNNSRKIVLMERAPQKFMNHLTPENSQIASGKAQYNVTIVTL
jgi:hypothetical protein